MRWIFFDNAEPASYYGSLNIVALIPKPAETERVVTA